MDARRAALSLLGAASCALAGGCSSIGSPATSAGSAQGAGRATTSVTSTRPQSPLAIARRTHEYPSPRPARERAPSAAATPTIALQRFATLYINWDANSVTAHMRVLARSSIGQARSEMQLAAANTARDYELRRGGIANSGSVEAIAPMRGSRDHYVVVTLERTTATNTNAYDGLRPAWHLALATLVRQGPGAWVVSAWLPEN